MNITSSPSRVSIFFLLALAPCVCAQDAYLQNIYQDATYLQRGLFEAPLPGMAPQRSRAKGDLERFTDKLHFSLAGGIRYDNNIYLTHKDEEDDVIFSVSPTFSYRSGEPGSAVNTVALTYAPSFDVYASNSDRNTVDHRFSFRYGREMPKSKLSFSLDYTDTSGSDRFVSGTVDRNSIRAAFHYNYILTGKTRLDISANSDIDVFDSSDLYGIGEYDLRASWLYQVTGKTSIGPSINYGHSRVEDSRDQDNYEIGVKFEYQATGKSAVTGTLGYNLLTFNGSGAASDETNLTWAIGARYDISGKTGIRASFYREPKVSYNFTDSGYMATGIALSGSHQLSTRTTLYAMLSYENDDYFQTSDNAGVSLDNNYYTATMGARHQLDNGFSFGANMTWRTNAADETVNEFDNFTVGLNASYNFW